MLSRSITRRGASSKVSARIQNGLLAGRSPERVVTTPFRGFRGLPHLGTLFIEFLGQLPSTVEVALRSASCHHELTIRTALMRANSPEELWFARTRLVAGDEH